MDFKAYAPVIDRFSATLALASLIPVVLSSRFSSSSRSLKDRDVLQRKSKDEQGGGGSSVTYGIGGVSMMLLLFSEIMRSWDILFVPAGSKKNKLGNLGALLKGAAKGKDSVSANHGAVENMFAVVLATLESEEAFAAAHGLLSVATVGVVLLCNVVQGVPGFAMGLADRESGESTRGGRGGSALSGRQKALLFIALLLPLIGFAWFQSAILRKAGKALLSEKLQHALHFPLRAAAIIAAAVPPPPVLDDIDGATDASESTEGAGRRQADAAGVRKNGGHGGAPAGFAALQVASLVASISAELSRGGLAGVFSQIVKEPLKLASHVDASAYQVLVPTLIALGWLFWFHLQRHLGALMISSLLCIATSPAGIFFCWPRLAAALGLDISGAAGAALLMEGGSLALAAVFSGVLMAGGTQSILVTMLLVQGLMRIHGSEPFMELFK